MKRLKTNSAATTRKLKLARETLRQLSAAELEVAGAAEVATEQQCRTDYPCQTGT